MTRKNQGFTLVELLAVLLIISVLAGFLLTSLFNAGETADARATESRILQLETAFKQYERDKGDFPPSTLSEAAGLAGTGANAGIEAATRTIFAAPYNGAGLGDDVLANTDGDLLAGEPLFEIVDLWENPIAYIRRQDYGKPFLYLTADGVTGEVIENEVVARKHPKTGRWANATEFQLISAGSDGVFGTEDDIANFPIEAAAE